MSELTRAYGLYSLYAVQHYQQTYVLCTASSQEHGRSPAHQLYTVQDIRALQK